MTFLASFISKKVLTTVAPMIAALTLGVVGTNLYQHHFEVHLPFGIHMEALGPQLRDAKAIAYDPTSKRTWHDEYLQANLNFEQAQTNANRMAETIIKMSAATKSASEASRKALATNEFTVKTGDKDMVTAQKNRDKILSTKLNADDLCVRIMDVDKSFVETLK